MAKAANKPRKKANGYKMPDPLPNGLLLTDFAKKTWKLGPSIGKGGFGEIYSAQLTDDNSTKKSTYSYVVKIEPHQNGPLFVEMHFYMRNAKPDDIEAFKNHKKLSTLGVPKYLGSGSHEYNGMKYRFIVMEKFGSDIWKLFLENKKQFPAETIFKLGVQILDVLEYIHSRGYIHADVKGANILLDLNQNPPSQVYLVDFGLCSRYDSVYKPNPKKAHNGTIEYVSCDGHLGVESRRGDLEILGYNLTQWFGCVLPWEKNLSDPVAVQNSKQKHMDNLSGFFKTCFGDKQPPGALVDFFKYIKQLKFETTPDYNKLRKILITGLEAAGGSLKTPFAFKSISKTKTPTKRKSSGRFQTPDKKAKLKKDTVIKKKVTKVNKDEMPEIDSKGDVNNIAKAIKKTPIRKPKVNNVSEDNDNEHTSEESIPGYTAEMLRIKNKLDAKKKPKKVISKKIKTITGTVDEIKTVGRTVRKQKRVNYKERSINLSLNGSVDIISASDEDV